MSVVRKTTSELVAHATALLDLSAALVDVEELRDLLISAFANIKGPIYYDEVDDFITGDNDIKSIATTAMSAGDIIAVNIDNAIHHYILVAATMDADISPYIIKPDDYNADTNAKYWLRANCKYFTFDNDDLNEGHSIVLKHDIGIQFVSATVFNNSNEIVPPCVAAFLSEKANVNVVMTDAVNITLTFAGSIFGTYKLLLIF